MVEASPTWRSFAMRDFRKLIVWRRAHVLAVDAHRTLQSVRAPGSASTRIQLQKALASIPANISEGCGKRSDAEFTRYLDIALGSATESENHLIFVHDLGWIDCATFAVLDAELTEVRRMLFSLEAVVRRRAEGGSADQAPPTNGASEDEDPDSDIQEGSEG